MRVGQRVQVNLSESRLMGRDNLQGKAGVVIQIPDDAPPLAKKKQVLVRLDHSIELSDLGPRHEYYFYPNELELEKRTNGNRKPRNVRKPRNRPNPAADQGSSDGR